MLPMRGPRARTTGGGSPAGRATEQLHAGLRLRLQLLGMLLGMLQLLDLVNMTPCRGLGE